jgi:metal-responsive CopG/Arc/MetJ family transcriptional regulator
MMRSNRIRIVIDLPLDEVERLDAMKGKVVGETRSAVIRQALQLLEFLSESPEQRFFVGKTKESSTEIRLIGIR